MLFKARFLLLAHASLLFGAVLSGAILSESLATHRPLNLWTWSFFGAMCIVEIALAGMHAHHHVPSASVVPEGKTPDPLLTPNKLDGGVGDNVLNAGRMKSETGIGYPVSMSCALDPGREVNKWPVKDAGRSISAEFNK